VPAASLKNHLIALNVGNIVNVITRPDAFTSVEWQAARERLQAQGFKILMGPDIAFDAVTTKLISGTANAAYFASLPENVTPSTDDNPFFFYTARFGDFVAAPMSARTHNNTAITMTFALIVVALVACLFYVVGPFIRLARTTPLATLTPPVTFFCAIGVGFMLIEISQMQRLVVFLGHPTYALSVVLFALLLSSGVGSFLTSSISGDRFRASSRAVLSGLLGALALFGVVTPRIAAAFESSSTPVRILLATGILFALGVFMGTAFPLGMKLAASTSESLTPWLWGVNGAMSVLASVVAVVIALTWGISASFWTGAGAYLIAYLAFQAAGRGETPAAEKA